MKKYPKGSTINCQNCGAETLRLTQDLYERDVITENNVEWAFSTDKPLDNYTPIVCGSCNAGLTFQVIVTPEGR